MKAIRYHPPGGIQDLRYENTPIPTDLGPGQMLIKVHAVGVIWTELYWPIYQNSKGEYVPHIPGHDYSGVVTKVGSGFEQSDIKVGSEVYVFTSARDETGSRKYQGAMAEFAVADLTQAVLKPRNLSFVEAAAVPLCALTAWQALHVHSKLQAGQTLLVTGAAGGTGVFAVQLGRMIGARVIGTASSSESFKLLKELGADEIIDYKKTSLEDAVKDVDVVLDTIGGDTLKSCLKVIKKSGIVININDPSCDKQAEEAGVRGMFFIVSMDAAQLKSITNFLDSGALRPVVDSVYPFTKAIDAFQAGQAGHVHGKIVIDCSDANSE